MKFKKIVTVFLVLSFTLVMMYMTNTQRVYANENLTDVEKSNISAAQYDDPSFLLE
ncbi:hypothetical protein [Clostridium sp. JN-1]|uniref:hypothetical protein n=1 Tax=Clostridium sp. JN-1 TaxID=2483110 RepID=UPI001680D71E|nr:hypothetical protein [Clostridium sp. JN-1]